jgi:DNA polymerase sigma
MYICENQVQTISVDIMVNKFLEIINSQLVRAYCLLDYRFRQVALVLKQWMHTQSGKKSDRLNSYSCYLLLIAYMIKKKYMPNLQRQDGISERILTVEIHQKGPDDEIVSFV